MIIEKVGLLVCGSRSIGGWDPKTRLYTNDEHVKFVFSKLQWAVDTLLKKGVVANKAGVIIISGAAHGPDELAMMYAHKNSVPFVTFPAQWDEHGNRAGFVRNLAMLDHADFVIAFYDGSSKGTAHTIREAKHRGLHQKTFTLDC